MQCAQGRATRRPRQNSTPHSDWHLLRRSSVAFLLRLSLYKPYSEALTNVFGMQRRFQYAQGHTTQRPRQNSAPRPGRNFRQCSGVAFLLCPSLYKPYTEALANVFWGCAASRHSCSMNIARYFRRPSVSFSLRSPLVSHHASRFYCLPFPYTANECAPIVNRTSRDQIHALTAVAGL